MHGPREGNAIYLSFDDGPRPEITPWVLDVLDKHQAKATFFVLGREAQQYPELMDRILRAGHQIGIHGYEHLNGWSTNNRTYIADVHLAMEFIRSDIFRPPYGRITPRQIMLLRQLGLQTVLWTHLSGDYDPRLSLEDCFHRSTSKVKSGSIIVFHDSVRCHSRLRALLPMCLVYYKEHGFEMKSLPGSKSTEQEAKDFVHPFDRPHL